MITFSVVTITYNAADVLKPTLDSVLRQSFPTIEHIIVDGASTDNTLAIADAYKELSDSAENGHVVRIKSEPDKGLYDAMNKGILKATGNYLFFLGADDKIICNFDDLIYLFKDLSKEKVTEHSILKEATHDNKKLEKILTESRVKQESTEEIFKKIFPNDNLSVDERIAKEERKRSTFGKALTRIDNALIAVILVAVIQLFYIGNYVIPTGSMEPTILVKDRVFTNMVKYHFSNPKIGQIIAFKEPMTDKVMYTKRIVGEPGTTLQIEKGKMSINEFEIANVDNKPSYPVFSDDNQQYREDLKKYNQEVNKFNSYKVQTVGGAIFINDKKSEVLEKVTPQKAYLPEGLLMNNKIYIPKKGDKVKLDKIVAIDKIFGEMKDKDHTLIGQVDWESYYDGKGFKNLTGKEFLDLIKTDKNFKDIIGNDDEFNSNPTNILTNTYYTFTLKVEGRDEMVMPIMDFKYDDELFKRLLNGETITLDKNYYMAMGDNTSNSKDTRYFGLVAEPRIKGELLVRWWPLTRIGLL